MKLIPVIFSALTLLLATAPSSSAEGKKKVRQHYEVDSVYVNTPFTINDYTLIGLQYGVDLSTPNFNPVRNSKLVFIPYNFGVTYTRYGKLFGYMPYFGIKLGLFYGASAYEFEESKSGYTDRILYAYKGRYTTLEAPVQAHLHVDFWKLKLMVDAGFYGGYRLDVHREYKPNYQAEKFRTYENSFHPNENRWDYGLKGGAGIALMFDPIEIHIGGSYKFSLQNLHQPNVNGNTLEHDANSVYYYKWVYPTDIVISLGIHYQLTRREGKTRRILRSEAWDEVRKIMDEARRKEEEAKAKEEIPDNEKTASEDR